MFVWGYALVNAQGRGQKRLSDLSELDLQIVARNLMQVLETEPRFSEKQAHMLSITEPHLCSVIN